MERVIISRRLLAPVIDTGFEGHAPILYLKRFVFIVVLFFSPSIGIDTHNIALVGIAAVAAHRPVLRHFRNRDPVIID